MTAVFVYGTLAPGECRWPVLAPYSCGAPIPDTIQGRLFNTGYGFPAAVVEPGVDTIPGFTVQLREHTVDTVLRSLDRIEGHPHLFERITVTTGAGFEVWVYQWATPYELASFTRIDSWIAHEYHR